MKPFVYCPYCGTPLEVRPIFGRERPSCNACGFVHFADPKVAVGVLVVDSDRTLLVKRAVSPRQGYWALPAGFMEAGELPEEAARREVLEETGLEVVLDGLIAIDRLPHPEKQGILLTFHGRVAGGRLQPQDDASAADWFAAGAIPWDDLAFETTWRVLQDWAAPP